jgi:hypothetical protein
MFVRISKIIKEEFEDTKGIIRIRISKKNKQHNAQMTTDMFHLW